jgi:hypothetical protein
VIVKIIVQAISTAYPAKLQVTKIRSLFHECSTGNFYVKKVEKSYMFVPICSRMFQNGNYKGMLKFPHAAVTITVISLAAYLCRMEANNQPASIRKQVVHKLTTRFSKEYQEIMAQYPTDVQSELTEHLKTLMEQLVEYVDRDMDSSVYTAVNEGEKSLLKKYGNRLAAYWNKKFIQYFDFGHVLAEKEVFTVEQYNSLEEAEQSLQPAEALAFAKNCIRLLEVSLPYIMLQTATESLTEAVEADADDTKPETGHEFTRARQLLAIHYLLEGGFGLGPHSGPDISSLARLAHLLTGTPYTSLQNSEIYKKYRHMPNFKKGPGLIADLLYIRSYFAELGLDGVVKQIDIEIAREQKEK